MPSLRKVLNVWCLKSGKVLHRWLWNWNKLSIFLVQHSASGNVSCQAYQLYRQPPGRTLSQGAPWPAEPPPDCYINSMAPLWRRRYPVPWPALVIFGLVMKSDWPYKRVCNFCVNKKDHGVCVWPMALYLYHLSVCLFVPRVWWCMHVWVSRSRWSVAAMSDIKIGSRAPIRVPAQGHNRNAMCAQNTTRGST